MSNTFIGPDGHTYNEHTPGDPMPCDGEAKIISVFRGEMERGSLIGGGMVYRAREECWTQRPDSFGNEVIGWRLAEEKVEAKPGESFQSRVHPWLMACFGAMIAGDREERNHRFLEEALELVQSCGCSQSEAHQLVDYVYSRPIGEPNQEAGGVMVTLAALCLANSLDMHEAGETELARIWTKVEKIREKQAAKPKHSPLPISIPDLSAVVVLPRETVEKVKAALTAISSNPHVNLEDLVYQVRESEGEGWDGEHVKAWGNACELVKSALAKLNALKGEQP